MKSLRRFTLLIPLFIAACASKPGDHFSAGKPKESASVVYAELLSLKPQGLPDSKEWIVLKPLLTPALAAKFDEARRQQQAFAKKSPGDKPPWVEGDLFSSLFEGPTNYEIKDINEQGKRAEVLVYLQNASDGQKVRWKDVLILKKVGSRWLLDDIRYGGNWPFAPRGTLSEMLTSGS
jgi:hypothetical protein